MAYLTNTLCRECGKTFSGDAMTGNNTCGDCKQEAADKKHDEHFAKLDAMTLEERIRKLEEDSYRRSIAPARYVAPSVYK